MSENTCEELVQTMLGSPSVGLQSLKRFLEQDLWIILGCNICLFNVSSITSLKGPSAVVFLTWACSESVHCSDNLMGQMSTSSKVLFKDDSDDKTCASKNYCFKCKKVIFFSKMHSPPFTGASKRSTPVTSVVGENFDLMVARSNQH